MFIPINIQETHWYLVVIHARNMEIQVLDSLGTSQDRKDLTDSVSMHKLNNYEFNINLSQSLILFYNIYRLKDYKDK